MAAILAIDAEREAPLLDREREPIGAGIAVVMRPPRREMIAFEQIVDRDPALLLDIRAAPQDGTLVELHVDDPRIGHAVAYRRAGEGNQSVPHNPRSEEHTSELQSLMRISYAVFCLKKK